MLVYYIDILRVFYIEENTTINLYPLQKYSVKIQVFASEPNYFAFYSTTLIYSISNFFDYTHIPLLFVVYKYEFNPKYFIISIIILLF